MAYRITSEERNILLENPELVMFDPYSGFKTHHASLGKALVLPFITGIVLFLWGYLYPAFMNAHPLLFAGTGCAALGIASGAVPVLYLISDDRTFRKAKEEHYPKQLKALLPEDLICRIAHIQWVTTEKAEGGWIMDGKEEMFGYASYVNYFRIEPDMDLAVITDNEKFWAFVKRDPKTECFYRDK